MIEGREAILAALRGFGAAHPAWVVFDEPSETLLEVASGRTLKLPVREIAGVVERQNAVTGQPYLLVELGDGRELALAEAGIAFPPSVPAVPQAPTMPPVVCMRDFDALQRQLARALAEQPEGRPPREVLDAVAVGIGILEGARRIGLDISEEERRLDGLLGELERRG